METAEAAVSEVEGFQLEEWSGDADLISVDPEDDDAYEQHKDGDESREDFAARVEAAEQEFRAHIEEQAQALIDMATGLEF